MTELESLPKDILEKLAGEMKPNDLIKFCQSQVSENLKKLCKDNSFWYRRFKKDFGFMSSFIYDLSTNSKKRYLQIFSMISKGAEILTLNIMKTFKNVEKYLKKEYKEDLYLVSYNYILETIEFILKQNKDLDGDKLLGLTDDFWYKNRDKIFSLVPGIYDEDDLILREDIFDVIYSATMDVMIYLEIL